MKYIFCIAILSIIVNNKIFSQEDSTQLAQNIIFVEAAGSGGYGSINYERIFFSNKSLMFSTRIGISTYHINDYTNNFNPDIILPFLINGCYGKNHKIELGIGQTFANIVQADNTDFKPKRVTNFHTIFSVGYRYQKGTGGMFFRCVYTPIIEFNNSYRNWAGISFGYSF